MIYIVKQMNKNERILLEGKYIKESFRAMAIA